MRRKTLDTILSSTGALLAILLLVIGGLLLWASNFASSQVSSQLNDQKITMPQGQELDVPAEDKAALEPYAGTPMDNGDKAKAYADHYIGAHLKEVAQGKTYAEISTAAQNARKDPARAQEAAQLSQQANTLFQGNALRSMLLTAYAFGTMGKIAQFASIACFIGAILLAILALLGFRHARSADADHVLATERERGARPSTTTDGATRA